MKLLLDQNLSFKLCNAVSDIFPDIKHIKSFKLEGTDDNILWEFAKNNSFIILTKDSDFNEKSIAKSS